MTVEVESRYGRMIVPDPDHDIIARFLVEQGEWAELETRFLVDVIKEGAKIADVGAFIGTFGLSLQTKKSLASICFVEANPEILPLLEENVKRNCHVEHTVVAALVAPHDFRADGSRDRHNLGSASFLSTNPDPGKIPVPPPDRHCTLRQLEEEHGPFDLIKLDVEGMELAILASEPELAKSEDTTLWMECNEHERSLELAEFLLAQGRVVHYFAFPSFNPDNFRASQKPIFPFAYEAGLLASSVAPQLTPGLIEMGCLLVPIASREDLVDALSRTPRWVPSEWWHLPPHQIVARAVHEMEQRAAAVRERDAALANAERIVTDLRSEIARRDAALAHAHARLAERRSYMIARERQLRVAEQARRRSDALAAERLVAAETHRAEREALERAAAHRLALLRAERDLRMEALREHKAALAAITASTTWRATAPLRALVTNLPRFRRMVRELVRGAVRVVPWRR